MLTKFMKNMPMISLLGIILTGSTFIGHQCWADKCICSTEHKAVHNCIADCGMPTEQLSEQACAAFCKQTINLPDNTWKSQSFYGTDPRVDCDMAMTAPREWCCENDKNFGGPCH